MKKRLALYLFSLFMFGILLLFSALGMAQKGEQPGVKEVLFNNPLLPYANRKLPVNYCMDPFTSNGCGKAAADSFCALHGFNSSKKFGWSYCSDGSYHLKSVAGRNGIAPGPQFKCFSYVICIR